jgi:thimet oligopeptidase
VKTASKVRVWDRFYYADKIRDEQFGVDGKALRAYFPYDRVISGILDFNAAFFGLTFDKLEGAEVWYDDVSVYNVLENGEIIGRFYLDMHPREGKYSHAAQFSMLTGVTGRQLPSGALVCNFPTPSKETPALLEHDQVVTVFHEFGHLMHEILAGRHPWVTLSGNATERDFVEVPSQLMEKWAWQYEVLEKFAVNDETGKPIPEDLVAKMNDADKFARGVHVMRQMSFAELSYIYHASDPRKFDLLTVLKQVQKKYNPYPYEKGTYFYDSFGHLESYSSLYYTYMWSLALSEDMFTRFEKEGIMNPDTARDLREKVLEPGGTEDAALMVRNFLGREQRFDALKAYLKDE